MKCVNSSVLDDLQRALGCFAIGVAVPALVISIPTSLILFPVVFFVGVVSGLPAIILSFVLIGSFRGSIHRHLRAWCSAAPFMAVTTTAICSQTALIDGGWFFGGVSQGVWDANMLALMLPTLFGSALAAFIFYRWTREAELQERDPHSSIYRRGFWS